MRILFRVMITSIANSKQISSIHTAESIPALKEENYIDNIRNYTSSIKYELERTRFPKKVKTIRSPGKGLRQF
jgi:hypothetical protein